MKTKICNKCKVEKSVDDFYTNFIKSKNKTYTRPNCKKCHVKLNRKHNDNKKDGYYYVYLLPDTKYIGMTDCILHRMRSHKGKGKNTTGYKVMFKSKNVKITALVELLFHIFGYNGFNYANRK